MEHSQIRDALGSIAAQGMRAQLILAMLLAALFPMFVLDRPIQTHAIKLDVPLDVGAPPAPAEPRFQLLSLPLIVPPENPARYHRLVVTAQDEMLIDGIEVDLFELSRRLNVIAVEDEWVDLRPEPDARYELFLQVLTITRRAYVFKLRLDNHAFRRALDERDRSRT